MKLTAEQQKFKKELEKAYDFNKKIVVYEALKKNLSDHPLNEIEKERYEDLIKQMIEKRREIENMIDTLDSQAEKDVLMLRFVGCYSFDEIKEIMHLEHTAMFNRYKKGIVHLFEKTAQTKIESD